MALFSLIEEGYTECHLGSLKKLVSSLSSFASSKNISTIHTTTVSIGKRMNTLIDESISNGTHACQELFAAKLSEQVSAAIRSQKEFNKVS